MVDYWTNLPGLETSDRCDGVAFSMLTMLDGVAALPRFTLAAQLESGEDLVINEDCDLHDIYAAAARKERLHVVIQSSADKADEQGE
jgi:hypothetical protein